MNLKDKIFSFGIFGKDVSALSNGELQEARSKPWVEILSPQQVEEFRGDFTMSAFRNDLGSGPIPKDYRIRMNLIAWRSHLFGPSFIVTNKSYFLIVDHLLKAHEFVVLSTLREMLKIDPKTMFYICKKLSEKGLIEERRVGREVSIRLVKALGAVDHGVQGDEDHGSINEIRSDSLVFYNNVSFVEQLKAHVEQAENGLDSKDLLRLTGMRSKFGLKHLQRLCQLYPERFKLVSSVDNKHTVFKCFAVDNLERRNARKLERMKSIGQWSEDGVDTLLSSKDRQSALWILAEKLGHFNLSKRNMREISRMTGYPYEIDRKNILNNARAAGLRVFTIPQAASGVPKYIVALPKYDASIVDLYVTTPNVVESNKFCKKLVRFFLNIESCVVEDNGYPLSPNISNRVLYRHLCDICKNSGAPDGYLDFNYQTVMEMSVECFYKTVKIRSLNFRARCAFEITKRRLLPDMNAEELFVGTEEPRVLNPRIFLVQDKVESMVMGHYIQMLPDSLQDAIREFAKPNRFVRKLVLLEKEGLIRLKVLQDETILFKVVSLDSAVQEDMGGLAGGVLFRRCNLNYNKRCEFLHRMRDVTENNIMDVTKQAVSKGGFTRSDQRQIYKYTCIFAKIKCPKRRQEDTAHPVVTKEQQDLYLLIKKAVVFQWNLDLSDLKMPASTDIEDILDYMSKEEIIAGFKTSSIVSSITIHPKFRTFLGEDFPEPCKKATDDQYIELFSVKAISAVKECGSVDFDALLSRLKFLEGFELSRILEQKSDTLERNVIDGFVFVSLANLEDPFS